jgi:AraC-like DNA-binding protein
MGGMQDAGRGYATRPPIGVGVKADEATPDVSSDLCDGGHVRDMCAPTISNDRPDAQSPPSPAASLYDKMPATLPAMLDSLAFVMPLLDVIPNVVFFVKDINARYVRANLTLATRCGFNSVDRLLGKTSEQVFPSSLGAIYTEQDREVIGQGKTITDQLELHLYPNCARGWCMTHKRPMRDSAGQVVGLVGISCDLQEAKLTHPAYARLAGVDEFLRENLSRTIAMSELTAMTGLSLSQFERYCKRIFHLTPRQMLHKFRLERATALLGTSESITNIAIACGYSDHSAFSRHFKSMTGISPSQFRSSS